MIFITYLAQIGKLNAPVVGMNSGVGPNGELTGMLPFLNSILRLIFVAAGVYAFFNLIMAGFQFINAGGDSESISAAWARIWQLIVGLVIIVTSFLVAALIGMILFKNPMAILNPTLGPQP